MLLLDGVRYEEEVPGNEAELEEMVIAHAQDIFGNNSVYFDIKRKMTTLGKAGAIPDGLAIVFDDKPKWNIVEVELSSHDAFGHVVPQVDRFIVAAENPSTRNKIVNDLSDEIDKDEHKKVIMRQHIGLNTDIHRFLADLVSEKPTITVIVEERTERFSEALRKYPQNKVIEFRTFLREDAKTVHIHMFSPISLSTAKSYIEDEFLQKLQKAINTTSQIIRAGSRTNYYLQIEPNINHVHFEYWLGKDNELSLNLHSEKHHLSDNERLMNKVLEHRNQIEEEVGERLYYESPWLDHYSRIYILPQISTTHQAIASMVTFSKAIRPILDGIGYN